MVKLCKAIRIALLAVAAACHVAPATAQPYQPYEFGGYVCHPWVALAGGNGTLIKAVFDGSVQNVPQCFQLCNVTPGCIAVQIITGHPGSNTPFNCQLYSGVENLQKYTPSPLYGAAMFTCLKLPVLLYPKSGDTPQTYQQIPPKFPHDQYRQQPRPTPQPSQTPSGRR